jgi:flagellar assembly factor FliW
MKLKVATKYHGEQMIEAKDIIRFEQGIPGFNKEKQFVILPYTEDSLFFILQSVSTPPLAFVIVNPFHFFKEYDIKIEDQVIETLQLSAEKDVTVFVILTVLDPFDKTTANLQAPVIINNEKRLGKQIILTGTDYQTKHTIFQTMVK